MSALNAAARQPVAGRIATGADSSMQQGLQVSDVIAHRVTDVQNTVAVVFKIQDVCPMPQSTAVRQC